MPLIIIHFCRYSYNGELFSRIKGCCWLLARGMRVLNPSKEMEKLQMANILKQEALTLKAEAQSFVSECRAALRPLKEICSELERQKRPLKTFDRRFNLLLFDEDDVDGFIPPIYDTGRTPDDGLAFENYPVTETPPFGHIVVLENRNRFPFNLQHHRESFDLLWVPSDECFYRATKKEIWYSTNRLSQDVKLDIFMNLVKTAKDLLKTSKNHIFSSIKQFMQNSPGQDADGPQYIYELLDHARFRTSGLLDIDIHKVSGLRMFRLQETIQDYFRLKGENNRIMRMFNKGMRWVEGTLPWITRLCSLDRRAWDKLMGTDTKHFCTCSKGTFYTSDYLFISVRIPLNEKLETDLFGSIRRKDNDNRIVMPYLNHRKRPVFNDRCRTRRRRYPR